MAEDYRLSVKAFILDENENLLIIKRSGNVDHNPDVWELPGGKIMPGDDPFKALTIETRCETDLKINIMYPLSVRHFQRDNGEIITMLVFVCNPVNKTIKLSERHSEYKWVSIEESEKLLSQFFKYEVIMYNNMKKRKYVHKLNVK